VAGTGADEGIVYILSNEAMPGYFKIGLTKRNDISDRLRELDNTSVPVPFQLHYAARVPDCRKLERTLHFVFGEKRRRLNREFFTINPDLAKAIIELVSVGEVRLSDTEQNIDAEKREEIDELKQRREVRTFTSLRVPIDSVLTFTKDPAIICRVIGPRKVLFEGQELSPSGAALKAVHAMGYTWPTVSGMEYWAYKGVKLKDLGGEPEPEPKSEDETLEPID
jgi:hypothetical protein